MSLAGGDEERIGLEETDMNQRPQGDILHIVCMKKCFVLLERFIF